MRYGILIAAIVASTFFSGFPASTARAASCQFVLGFATLHSLIPGIVGQCLENEHHNPVNGDALQATTNGLLVWRKSDNFTAFTDGFRSWVNGPFGVQTRLNSQRFSWEQNPDRLAIVPPPAAGQQCHTAGLSLRSSGVEAGAGNFVGTFVFTNDLSVPCTFFGFVGAQRLDSQNNPLPTRVVRGGTYVSNLPGPSVVTVPAGGTATFKMHWEDVPVGNETTCVTSSQLAVTPPNEFVPLIVPIQITACGGGELDVSAVQPPV
ncbi:MAG: DUF4232 domain-containing protein [Chloroflexota bacterium]